MKFLRLTFLIAIIGGFCLLASCDKGNGPEPSIEETQLKALSQTWTISQVRFGAGNTDRTSEYAGMTLTITGTFSKTSGTSYQYSRSTLANLSPWPKTGSWTFDANDPETLIIRAEDNLPITYSVTGSQLQLTFTYAGAGYAGRTSAVEGSWTFLFTR